MSRLSTMVDKRTRRSSAELRKLRMSLVEIIKEHRPLTVRHLFYLAVAARLIQKTEAEYKNVIIRIAGEMREEWLLWQDPNTTTLQTSVSPVALGFAGSEFNRPKA